MTERRVSTRLQSFSSHRSYFSRASWREHCLARQCSGMTLERSCARFSCHRQALGIQERRQRGLTPTGHGDLLVAHCAPECAFAVSCDKVRSTPSGWLLARAFGRQRRHGAMGIALIFLEQFSSPNSRRFRTRSWLDRCVCPLSHARAAMCLCFLAGRADLFFWVALTPDGSGSLIPFVLLAHRRVLSVSLRPVTVRAFHG